jgi:hypothetical protein
MVQLRLVRGGWRGWAVSDWVKIDVQQFMQFVLDEEPTGSLVGRLILDRLPYAFDSKKQFFAWKDELAEGIGLDARDILVVGSAATGRSINPRKKFGVFGSGSDIDIAIISPHHFEVAWAWFRRTNPTFLTLNEEGHRLFRRHREQYVFDGMIAADYFLGFLPFGPRWIEEIQRCGKYLPPLLQGRTQKVRIYKDNDALRQAQLRGLSAYHSYLKVKKSGSGEVK